MTTKGNDNNQLEGLELLLHDFKLYGEFTEETEIKIFGPKPYIPEEPGKEQDAAIEAAAERMAQIKCMLERMHDLCAQPIKAENEDMDCPFEGFDIFPIVHDHIFGHKVNGFTIEHVFGEIPRLIDSPDNDTRMESYYDRANYCTRAHRAEAYADTFIAGKKSELQA